MADVLEMIMMICFGLSWPINIRKAWVGRTAKGISVMFYGFIVFGYGVGLLSKYIKLRQGIHTPLYVWFFYILNSVIVAAGILIWFRNLRLDRKTGAVTESVEANLTEVVNEEKR